MLFDVLSHRGIFQTNILRMKYCWKWCSKSMLFHWSFRCASSTSGNHNAPQVFYCIRHCPFHTTINEITYENKESSHHLSMTVIIKCGMHEFASVFSLQINSLSIHEQPENFFKIWNKIMNEFISTNFFYWHWKLSSAFDLAVHWKFASMNSFHAEKAIIFCKSRKMYNFPNEWKYENLLKWLWNGTNHSSVDN